MVMIPFSLIGVAWGHWLHGFPINISSFLGIIALIGIVVNDGLVLIGKFNSNLKTGMKFDDALLAAGKSRFRPIFLTSITTVAGLGPLIFEKSLQAQFLIPMAVSIAYGILVATLLTSGLFTHVACLWEYDESLDPLVVGQGQNQKKNLSKEL